MGTTHRHEVESITLDPGRDVGADVVEAPETQEAAGTDGWSKRLRSKQLATQVLVAAAATVVLAPISRIAVVAGALLSPILTDFVQETARQRRWSVRRIWGVAALLAFLGWTENSYGAARRCRPGASVTLRRRAVTCAAATCIVVAGFTLPEAVLGHSIVGAGRYTFFGAGDRPSAVGIGRPVVGLTGRSPTTHAPRLTWRPVGAAAYYLVLRDHDQPRVTRTASYTDRTASLGRHTYRVTWVSAAGVHGARSAPVTIVYQTVPPPAAVSGLRAESPTTHAPHLLWTAAGSRVDHYVVYRDHAHPTPVAGTTYTDTAVTYGSYTYQVAWVKTSGVESRPSRPVTVVYQSQPALTAVTGLRAPSPTSTPPSLAWNSVGSADHYVVYRAGAPPVTVKGPAYRDRNAAHGTYVYRVAWVNASGIQSRLSAPATVIYQAVTPPPPVSGLQAPSPTTQAPALTWNAVPGASTYVVYRNGVIVDSTTVPNYTDRRVDYGTFTYQVGWKTNSGVASALSNRDTIVYDIPAPANVQSSSTLTNTPVAITWSAVPRADHYSVYRNGTVVDTPTSTSFTEPTVPPDATYDYRVTATTHAGAESAESAVVQITYDTTAPAAPIGLVRLGAIDTEYPTLRWRPSKDAHGPVTYLVYRKGNPSGMPSPVTAFTDTSAQYGLNSYVVVALDSLGNRSPASHPVNIPYAISPPSGLTGASPTTDSPALTWGTVPGATAYTLYRGGVMVYSGGDTTYTDAGATPGSVYSYTVTATDGHGIESAPSGAVRITYN